VYNETVRDLLGAQEEREAKKYTIVAGENGTVASVLFF
jgi:hypothetical protein